VLRPIVGADFRGKFHCNMVSAKIFRQALGRFVPELKKTLQISTICCILRVFIYKSHLIHPSFLYTSFEHLYFRRFRMSAGQKFHRNKRMNPESLKRPRIKSKSGYLLDLFPTPPRAEFLCKACSQVVKRPKECTHCGLLMCGSCWENTSRTAPPPSSLFFLYSGREEVCPNCRLPTVTREPSRLLRRLVLNLEVKCKNCQLGCGCILPLGDMKAHESGCAYKLVQCGNYMCAKKGRKVAFFPVYRPSKPGSGFVCSQVCKRTVDMISLLAQNEVETAIGEFYKAASEI